jgi:hypothetical protein
VGYFSLIIFCPGGLLLFYKKHLNSLINKINPEIVRHHWAGDKDILDLIQQIIQVADEMVGSGLWANIRKGFGK